MPPSFSPTTKPPSTNKTISSFFNPVKKPIDNDTRSKIKVNSNLKNISRSMFASKSSAFSLPNSRSGSSSSTENLAETFGKVGFGSKPKKPLIDLTSAVAPRRRLKQQRRPIDSDDDEDMPDSNSGDEDGEAIVTGNKRVLRERKPVMNRIIFSSDEEADLDEDEGDDDDQEEADERVEEGSMDGDDNGSTGTSGKKRRQPFSDSEDDVMGDEDDQLYNEKPTKTIDLHQRTQQTKKLNLIKSRLSQLANGSKVADKEIRATLRKDPSVVNAYQTLATKAANRRSPVKKPRLTQKHHYNEKDGVIELSDNDSNGVIDISESEQDEDSSGDDDSGSDADEGRRVENRQQKQTAVVLYFNTCSSKDFQIMTGCKSASADKLIELRPFADEEDLEVKLRQTKGLSAKYIENCYEMMSGYRAVDQIIKKVENLGVQLRNTINIWEELNNSRQGSPAANAGPKEDDQPGMNLTSISLDRAKANSIRYRDALEGYLTQQPDIVNPEMTLKDYQILGVNWMLLLYRKGISGILADEMGLGKTAQVISFLGRLCEIGETGPHLIVVPSSTIQNWEREFERFCPDLEVRLYHGSQQERMEQRINLQHENEDNEFQVIITTYNLASGHADDRKFFKRLECQSMILDEGHMVKNCTSARYKSLMSIKTPFRLLLTGTPLQNNLQELVSLLTFIMPDTFAQHEEDIRSIFKIRKSTTTTANDTKSNELGTAADETSIQVLAKERISRAKRMMTPFVLRRKKENVLKDLPNKTQMIEHCDMTENQAKLYNHIIEQTKKKYQALESATAEAAAEQEPAVVEKRTDMQAQFEDMSNVVIHLRKAADHPLMFRNVYTDDMLREMAKELHKDVKYWDSNLEYMYEDFTVMSDFEIDRFCREEKRIQHYCLKNQEWMDSGKIERLKQLLPKFKKEGNKVLIFSQFTKMLDILELVMQTIDISFLRLDGETKVMERQNMIDEFNNNADINVTKAGGFGINLTSANIVILYDIDFNPQNDKQAEDRAHRVGQTKDVVIHKLICRDTIEEYILKMANMKLRLDKNMSSADDELVEEEKEDNTSAGKGVHSILKEAFLIADNRAK
ncbi:SNF2 family N-terminal domain-containing protein [Mucor lusitanicus]